MFWSGHLHLNVRKTPMTLEVLPVCLEVLFATLLLSVGRF
jgi:hypothetical protein